EPVRDVRLTGWYRASADLVRRVAGCEEWGEIEKLRIHNQGPHKHPREEVLLLLESPHLTRLQALDCGLQMEFGADARRRFERLEVLRRARELRLPALRTYPHRPGEWFSDGGTPDGWEELRSIALPHYPQMNTLRQLTAAPFWEQLTALEIIV